ncbi:hypothetical protein H0H81_000445 [Sphagnurus paluster]|uniref:Uncharacterized protein n=1 Tax=Sphagnurus paluster TaxID=117069 RepID=A0A9P7KI48_9AGAR|nr:hypothetical protein H0H81_000445 [Sphagnurus paluster]
MGNVVSDIVKQIDNSDEKEARAKEQLEMLMKLADARLDTFQGKLKTMFLDKESRAAFLANGLFGSNALLGWILAQQ